MRIHLRSAIVTVLFSLFVAVDAMVFPILLGAAEPAKPAIKMLTTTAGVPFGLVGEKGAAPAPTLFLFTFDIQMSLSSPDFTVGQQVARHGFLVVSLDVPCHGKDARSDEPGYLNGWRVRTEKGESWLPAFTVRVRDVLNHLVKEGYTDPERVAVAGSSRGGFIAGHVAATEPRFRAVIAFAPVTELMNLGEFAGTPKADAVRALNLVHVADKLVGRSLWLCIGNSDQRVGTDGAIAFARKVTAASLAAGKHADVFLVVTPDPGHNIHKTAYSDAVAWLLERINGTN